MSAASFAARFPSQPDAMMAFSATRPAQLLKAPTECEFAASLQQPFSMPLTPSPSHSTSRQPPAPATCCDFAFRVYEFNRRLQLHEPENRWWEALIQEFFEDDAVLSLSLCLEDGPHKFTIGRALIGRYFRSIYESGVIEYFIQLYHPRESFRTTTLTLECENTQIVTQHIRPMFSKVVCYGHLVLEFTCNELMRIRSWHFTAKSHHEFIPRNMLALQEPTLMTHLSRNITRCGVTANTLSFLKLCTVLEPMQVLMARQKATDLNPRDSLRTVIQERWQMLMQSSKQTGTKGKRGQRREPVDELALPNVLQLSPPKTPRKKRSIDDAAELMKKRQKADDKMNQNITGFQKQSVLVVGEPKLLSNFYAEEERPITRVENSMFDAQAQLFDNGSREQAGFRSTAPLATACCSEQWAAPWDGFGAKSTAFVQPLAHNAHTPFRPDRLAQPQPQQLTNGFHSTNGMHALNGMNGIGISGPHNSFGLSGNSSMPQLANHMHETWQVPISNGHGNLQF